MEPQNSSLFAKQPVLFGVLVLIIGIIIGAFAGPYLPFSSSSSSSYQAGFNAAKSLAEQSSLGSILRGPDDVHTLAGTVTAINGTRITLHTVSNNPFDNPSASDRTVLVATSTKIIKFMQEDIKVFKSEMEAFTKAKQTGASSSTTPPVLFTLTASSLANIKVGDALTVTALENIKLMTEFTANEIQIQSQTVPPEPQVP